jgi:hypothetical protein
MGDDRRRYWLYNTRMKHWHVLAVCVCAFLAVAGACTAADSGAAADTDNGEPYFFYMISCSSYIEHRTSQRNAETQTADMYYITGWLSAYNRFHSGDNDITQDTDVGGVMLWLEDYCRENPLSNVEAGLVQLTADLHAKNAARPTATPLPARAASGVPASLPTAYTPATGN